MRQDFDLKGHQFGIVSKAVSHYQPWVRLSVAGREQLSGGKPVRGRLVGITEGGSLKVRKATQKTVREYASRFWEFDPKQSA